MEFGFFDVTSFISLDYLYFKFSSPLRLRSNAQIYFSRQNFCIQRTRNFFYMDVRENEWFLARLFLYRVENSYKYMRVQLHVFRQISTKSKYDLKIS